jgi:Xaa-Pro dipeptidase
MTSHDLGYAPRIRDIQAVLHALELDGIVLKLPENILFATGHWIRMGGFSFVFVPREGAACLAVFDFEVDDARRTWTGPLLSVELGGVVPANLALAGIMTQLAEDAGCLGGRIGFEGSFEYLSHAVFGEATSVAGPTLASLRGAFRTDDLVDATSAICALRASKSPQEIERLRISNEIADVGLDLFKRLAVVGATEAGVAATVEAAIRSEGIGYRGVRDVRAYAMVCSGEATGQAWQPYRTTARAIAPGDLVMIEMGMVADGYWCDRTRTVCSGVPTVAQRQAYDAVRAAQAAAIRASVPGALARDVDALSRDTCASHGVVQHVHHTGHGVGFGYHEPTPIISPRSEAVLSANNVLAIEPGVYSRGMGGVRWEDTVLVGSGGGVVLGAAEFGLD